MHQTSSQHMRRRQGSFPLGTFSDQLAQALAAAHQMKCSIIMIVGFRFGASMVSFSVLPAVEDEAAKPKPQFMFVLKTLCKMKLQLADDAAISCLSGPCSSEGYTAYGFGLACFEVWPNQSSSAPNRHRQTHICLHLLSQSPENKVSTHETLT